VLIISLVKARCLIVFSFRFLSYSKFSHHIFHLELEILAICEAYNGIHQYLDIGIKYTLRQCAHGRFQIYDPFVVYLYCSLNEVGFKIVNEWNGISCVWEIGRLQVHSSICTKYFRDSHRIHIVFVGFPPCLHRIHGIPTVFTSHSWDPHRIYIVFAGSPPYLHRIRGIPTVFTFYTRSVAVVEKIKGVWVRDAGIIEAWRSARVLYRKENEYLYPRSRRKKPNLSLSRC
jgi:hypothetical protein